MNIIYGLEIIPVYKSIFNPVAGPSKFHSTFRRGFNNQATHNVTRQSVENAIRDLKSDLKFTPNHKRR